MARTCGIARETGYPGVPRACGIACKADHPSVPRTRGTASKTRECPWRTTGRPAFRGTIGRVLRWRSTSCGPPRVPWSGLPAVGPPSRSLRGRLDRLEERPALPGSLDCPEGAPQARVPRERRSAPHTAHARAPVKARAPIAHTVIGPMGAQGHHHSCTAFKSCIPRSKGMACGVRPIV